MTSFNTGTCTPSNHGACAKNKKGSKRETRTTSFRFAGSARTDWAMNSNLGRRFSNYIPPWIRYDTTLGFAINEAFFVQNGVVLGPR